MSFKGVRIPIVVLTLSLTLVFLFGARWLYQREALDRPLEQAVRAVPGVEDAALDQQAGSLVVKVKAGDVARLEEFVARIWRAVESVKPARPVSLRLSDSRNQHLEDLYYEFHFFLQEAVATGRYSELPTDLARVTEGQSVSRRRVFVGPDYVYLQMHQGGASLYEIVPRAADSGAPAGGGAASEPVRSVTVGPWEGAGS